MKKIIFIGNARDFHAMDWYRTVKQLTGPRPVMFATDLIHSEGHPLLVNDSDDIIPMFNIDRLLLAKQSHFGNIWRNLVKLLVFPLQVACVKRIHAEHPDAVFHAHTMYYLFISWVAGISYIGTPQGSEVLVRPHRSRLYKFFASRSLAAATHVIVDSVNMQNGISRLCGKEAVIIQNGIDVDAILMQVAKGAPRRHVVSIRGMHPNYRIEEIFKGRSRCKERQDLTLFYPFGEEDYKEKVLAELQPGDRNLGRIPTKEEMYALLADSLLAISVPASDSSPRSVYEAVFCGCCVALTYNPFIEALPACMKARLVVVDLEDEHWLEKALARAREITATPYHPSEAALDTFSETRTMKAVAERFYA